MFTEWNSLLAIHKSHITFLKPHTSWTQPPNVHKLHVRHVEQLCTNFHLRQVQESGEINVGWFNWWRCEFAIVWLDWSRELTGGGELLFYRAWLSPLVLIQPSDVILPEWNISARTFLLPQPNFLPNFMVTSTCQKVIRKVWMQLRKLIVWLRIIKCWFYYLYFRFIQVMTSSLPQKFNDEKL